MRNNRYYLWGLELIDSVLKVLFQNYTTVNLLDSMLCAMSYKVRIAESLGSSRMVTGSNTNFKYMFILTSSLIADHKGYLSSKDYAYQNDQLDN